MNAVFILIIGAVITLFCSWAFFTKKGKEFMDSDIQDHTSE